MGNDFEDCSCTTLLHIGERLNQRGQLRSNNSHRHYYINTATFKNCENVITEPVWLAYLLSGVATGNLPKGEYFIRDYSIGG